MRCFINFFGEDIFFENALKNNEEDKTNNVPDNLYASKLMYDSERRI